MGEPRTLTLSKVLQEVWGWSAAYADAAARAYWGGAQPWDVWRRVDVCRYPGGTKPSYWRRDARIDVVDEGAFRRWRDRVVRDYVRKGAVWGRWDPGHG